MSGIDRPQWVQRAWVVAAGLLLGLAQPTAALSKPATDASPEATVVSHAASTGSAAAVYEVRNGEGGAHLMHNPRHAITAEFSADGQVRIDLARGGRTASCGLQLVAYGSEGSVVPPAAPQSEVTANRLEYRRGPLVEWYVNDARGLEQGFTIAEPPAGAEDAGIVLDLALSGARAAVDEDGRSLMIRSLGGASLLRYGDLQAFDADGRVLPAQAGIERDGAMLRLTVDAREARYPITVDPLLTSFVIKVTPHPSEAAPGDIFGRSVAVSCGYMAVGAPFDDDEGEDSGSVFILSRNSESGEADVWQPVVKYAPSDVGARDSFGYAVDLHGDLLVVGAMFDDDGGDNAGAAYILEKRPEWDDGWDTHPTVTKILASDAEALDQFGISVAVDGDLVVVGANREDSQADGAGAAYIYQKIAGTWTEVAKLTASDGGPTDNLGGAVSISGDTVVVGARYYSPSTTDLYDYGAAYVFERNQGGADQWGEVARLMASDGAVGDLFGASVDIDRDTIVVGARDQDEQGENAGAAYVFARNRGGADAWGEVAKLTAPDGAAGDHFGESVRISGDAIVVGAFDHEGSTGAAYVFERNRGGADGWGVIDRLAAPDGAAGDLFGIAVGIDGNQVAVGASGDDDNGDGSGAAYVFRRGGESWQEVAREDLIDAEMGDDFGWSIAVDGDSMVAGAPGVDVDSIPSGAAYVFQRNHATADAWDQVAELVASDGAGGDSFGESVAISGGTVVVGAHYEGTEQIGAAYVFDRNQGGADAWGEVAKLVPSDGGTNDGFGSAVAIDSDLIVVGAPTISTGTGPGAAYVFARNEGGANAWGEVAILTASDGLTDDEFGTAVGIDGDLVVVGARDAAPSGAFYVFDRNLGGADAWGQVTKVPSPNTHAFKDYFGTAVAIGCDSIVVGAPGRSDVRPGAGAAHVFRRNEGGENAWGMVATLLAVPSYEYEEFGSSVDLQCDAAIVGAPHPIFYPQSWTGVAYIFRRNTGGPDAWGQEAKITPRYDELGGEFGRSVGIAGNHAVAGAPVLNTWRGRAYVFQYQAPLIDLSVSKSNGQSFAVAGQVLSYEIEVENHGTEDALGATVTDTLPAELTNASWTCTPSGTGAACASSGTGGINGESVDLPSGTSVLFTLTATVDGGASGQVSNTVTVSPPSGVGDPLLDGDTATDTDPLPPVDFGDAPDSSVDAAWQYPTSLADGGAVHALGGGLFLGATVDAESDGLPSLAATGDDLDGSDDEDGVALPAQLVACLTSAIGVTVSEEGYVNGWIDFNNDGDWNDAGERVVADVLQSAGTSNYAVAVPCTATLTARTYVRFRVADEPGLGPGGLAASGEVEDYAVEVVQRPDPLQVFTATAVGGGSVELQWINPDEPYAATSIWARTNRFPALPNEIGARPVTVQGGAAGAPDVFVDAGCAAGTTCYYAGFASDSGGNYSAGTNVAARPPSEPAVAWVYSTGAAALVPPSPLPGIAAFTASNDRRIHSMDSATGQWPAGWAPPLMNEPAQGRSPVVNLTSTTIGGASTVIFAGSQDGHVYAFDAADGSELWQSAELGSEVQAAPSVMFTDFGAPFNLVVASARDLAGAATVYGLDPADGSTLWSFDNGGGENAIGVVSAQASLNWLTSPPRAFFASRAHPTGSSDTAWCLELATDSASLRWSQPVGDSDGTALFAGPAVYVGNNAGQVLALQRDTGAALWSSPYSTGDGPVKSWVWLTTGTRLFFSTTDRVHGVTDIGVGSMPPTFWNGGVVEQKKLKASDPGANDEFSRNAVALDGDTILVGAESDYASLLPDSGSAYVFERDLGGSGNWGQRLKLTASDRGAYGYFGSAVAISGDTAVVGSRGDDELASYAGAAYVFERDYTGSDAWGERAKLLASDGALWDLFGASVAISNDTVIVGAYGDDGRRGAAYIFERNLGGTDTWGQRAKLVASDRTALDSFGVSVDVAGDVAVVGAQQCDPAGQADAGCAYVFERNAGGADNWGQVRKLVASDAGADDYFGAAVAVDGDVIVVGAHRSDDVGLSSGSVYIFERNQGGAGNWGEVAKLGPADQAGSQLFGFSVACDGSRIVIGAYSDDEAGSTAGAAYVFEQDAGGVWRERQKLLASDGEGGDWFGQAVAVSAGTVAVGALYDDDVASNSGAAYVFGGSTPFVIPGASAPIVVNGKAYVGSSNGRLYEIDTTVAAPAPKWIELGDPAVDKTIGAPGYDVTSGRVIVGSDEGRIYAVEVPL